jgi:hypothetical protein
LDLDAPESGYLGALHDALMDGYAHKKVLSWSIHKHYGPLLCQWIAKQ